MAFAVPISQALAALGIVWDDTSDTVSEMTQPRGVGRFVDEPDPMLPEGGQGMICVYRVYSNPSDVHAPIQASRGLIELLLDGEPIGRLGRGQRSCFEVDAGEHWIGNNRLGRLRLEVRPRRIAYVLAGVGHALTVNRLVLSSKEEIAAWGFALP